MTDQILSAYSVPAGHFDELLDAGGEPRRWWTALQSRADLSVPHLSHAQARVTRQMHENGVTYNVYAAEDGPNRPWTLDVLPHVVEAQEWSPLASGLRQRARVLNALAADLYGRQQVLRDGVIPPGAVFRHPGYLRACHGVVPPNGVFLHLVAFDVARDPDGRWIAVSNRTQAPSGAGYALENRATIPRLFPAAFRDLHVQPLAAFFDRLRHLIVSTAPCDDDSPHVALLTPGPYNETYFEQSYLAKFLGFSLVQGADLTVRDDRVFLKTISGLRPVHALLRRLDDDYCDPLELKSDSTLGVPGLVQAWRAGRVLVANAFGTGLLESPEMTPLLAPVSERLLGESLQIAGAGAAEGVPLSHVPVWHDGHLESRMLILRVFLAGDGAGDYHVMPGGLARIAGDRDPIVSSQRGGASKDTWVLSGEPMPAPHARSAGEARRQNDLGVSSRAAEHLFWLGRYAERAENCARLLRAVLTRLSDPSSAPTLPRAFVKMCLGQGALLPTEAPADDDSPADQAATMIERLVAGLFDRRLHRSLSFNIEQTVRVAGTIRERLSPDNWRVLNQLATDIFDAPRLDLNDTLAAVDQSIVSLVAAGGLEMAHMTRDDGWRFLSVGRHLERLLFTAATLRLPSPQESVDSSLLGWLLELSDSLLTFRARFVSEPEWPAIVDLLLFDAKNPRSLVFQLAKLAKHVSALPGGSALDVMTELRALESGCRALEFSFEKVLERCHGVAVTLSDTLTLKYFSHADLPFATTAR
jgi:uncharacterized circularly permuted ATP-grasp superfamily protein/uncharacterized alpha-E superfamily protein